MVAYIIYLSKESSLNTVNSLEANPEGRNSLGLPGTKVLNRTFNLKEDSGDVVNSGNVLNRTFSVQADPQGGGRQAGSRSDEKPVYKSDVIMFRNKPARLSEPRIATAQAWRVEREGEGRTREGRPREGEERTREGRPRSGGRFCLDSSKLAF